MSSNAKEIRDSFKMLLEDGQVHSRTELFAYARQERSNKHYTEGMLTGALKTLTDPGTGYKCVGRGLYQKADADNDSYADSLIGRYIDILKKTLETIEEDISVNPFKLLEINETDKQKLKKVETCIATIKEVVLEMER